MHWRALATLIYCNPLPLFPQDKSAAQIKVESRLVFVDLVATDNKGDFVSNLQPGEIRVFEDNQEEDLPSRPGRRASCAHRRIRQPHDQMPGQNRTGQLPAAGRHTTGFGGEDFDAGEKGDIVTDTARKISVSTPSYDSGSTFMGTRNNAAFGRRRVSTPAARKRMRV